MPNLIDKFKAAERDISSEKGPFALFALFQREDGLIDKWDVVVSAPWFGDSKPAILNYIVDKLESHLDHDDWLAVSRIITLDPNDDRIRRLQEEFSDGQLHHVWNRRFFDMQMREAYILTAGTELPVSVR
jgi:hypothetical protein